MLRMNPDELPDSIFALGFTPERPEATVKKLGRKLQWRFKRVNADLLVPAYLGLRDRSANLDRDQETVDRVKNIKEETRAAGVEFYG